VTAATFERGAFEERLDQVERLLADLWAVDAALEAIPKPTGTFGSTLGGVKVRLGRSYPFEEHILAPGVDPASLLDHAQNAEATRRFVARLEDDGRSWAAQVVGGLRCAVEDIVRPIPSEFADAEAAVRSQLSMPLQVLVNDDFGMLSSHLSDWEGRAAEQFADYFYNRVQGAVDNQVVVAEGICLGLAASKAIVHQGQHSLMGLVEATHQVIVDQLRQRQQAHASIGWSTADWLMLVGTLAAVAGAIPTGGATMAASAMLASMYSATGELLQFASTQVEEGEMGTVEAATAQDAAGALRDFVEQIRLRLFELWDEASVQMRAVGAIQEAAKERRLLWPARPRLADGVGPDDYYHESAGIQ
jgi:hypothetical protein